MRPKSKRGNFVWIDLEQPTEAELSWVAQAFGMHELAFEDLSHGKQRPKVEDYGDHEFVTIKTLRYDDPSSQVETGELAAYIGPDFIITARQGTADGFDHLRTVIEGDATKLALGPYQVLHLVLDWVVDGYGAIGYELEHDVTTLERKVFGTQRRSFGPELYFLKREIIEFRRAVDPMRHILTRLSSDGGLLVPEAVRPFFRDIDDHVNRAADQVAALDALLAAAMSADMTQAQIRQNEDMRKISSYAALAAVPTMVAGIYGMNFDFMPELHEAWGYPAVMALMVGVSVTLYRRFKRSGWL